MRVLINQTEYADVRKIDYNPKIDLYASSLPITQIGCEILANEMINNDATLKFVDENDVVWASYRITSVEWAQMGVQRVKAEPDLSILDKTKMKAHMYSVYESQGSAFGAALEDILSPLTGRYTVTMEVYALPLFGFAPKQTRRERLLWCLFTTGTYLAVNNEGRLEIKMLTATNLKLIPIQRTFWKPTISYTEMVTKIKLTAYKYDYGEPLLFEDYVTEDTNEDVVLAYGETYTPPQSSSGSGDSGSSASSGNSGDESVGDGDLGFSSGDDSGSSGGSSGDSGFVPGDDPGDSGGTGTGSGGDSGFVPGDDPGEGGGSSTPSGDVGDVTSGIDTYTQKKIYKTYANPDAVAGALEKEIDIDDITMVTPNNADGVLARLAQRYFNRMQVEADIINNHEYSPGEMVMVYLDKKTIAKGYIESCNYKFGVQARSKIKLVNCEEVPVSEAIRFRYVYGQEVIQEVEDEFYYPVGWEFSFPTEWLDITKDERRRIFRPQSETVTGTATTSVQTIDIPCDLLLDYHDGLVHIHDVEKLTEATIKNEPAVIIDYEGE